MKRLLLLLLTGLALASPSLADTQATLAVAYYHMSGTDQSPRDFKDRNLNAVSRVMDDLGIRYRWIDVKGSNTEQFRTGVFSGLTADAVMFPSMFRGGGNTNANYAPCRIDSLTLSASGGMTVPSLWLADNVSSIAYGVWPIDVAAETTGVLRWTVPNRAQLAVLEADQSLRIMPGPYNAGAEINTANPPAGGVRVILRTTRSGGDAIAYNTAFNAQWPDSAPWLGAGGSGADTAAVWERLWTHITGAMPQVFCAWTGAGGVSDSVGDTDATGLFIPSEGSYDVLIAGFARLDSLVREKTGKRLITKPIRGAFAISGFLNNSVIGGQRGRAVADTARFYGSLDSLKAWGVPFVGGANVDSAASYSRDLIKMRELSRARWTPQVWTGIQDSTRASNASAKRPIDIFGHFRNRVAYGPTDTTTYSLLSYASYKLDSLGLKRSSTLLPPLLDYSPKQCRRSNLGSGLVADSVLYAASLLGYNAVVVNTNEDQSNPTKAVAATQVNGWRRTESSIRVLGVPFKVLGSFSILPPYASTRQYAVEYLGGGATVPAAEAAWISYLYNYPEYSLHALLFDRAPMDRDMYAYDAGYSLGAGWYDAKESVWNGWMQDRDQWPHRGSVVVVTCDALSGRASDPARTGLWQIKTLWNAAKVANAIAGKTVWTWGYPEDVQP